MNIYVRIDGETMPDPLIEDIDDFPNEVIEKKIGKYCLSALDQDRYREIAFIMSN